MYFNNSSLIHYVFISGPVEGYTFQSLWYVPLGGGSITFRGNKTLFNNFLL